MTCCAASWSSPIRTAPSRPTGEPRVARRAWWHLGGGRPPISAGDTAEAVEMVASSWLPLATSGGHQTVHSWLTALPREVHRGDARLCVASAVTAIGTGRVDEVGAWIDLAEEAPAAGPFHDGFASGAAAAGCLRAAHNWLTGDLAACRESALGASEAGGEPSPWDAVTYTGGRVDVLARGQRGRHRAAGSSTRAQPPGRSRPRRTLLPGGAMRGPDPPRHAARTRPGAGARRRRPGAVRPVGLLEYWINVAAHTARAGLLTHAGRLDEARASSTGHSRSRDAEAGRWRPSTPWWPAASRPEAAGNRRRARPSATRARC